MHQEQFFSGRWLRTLGTFLIVYSIIGLLVDAAVPRFLPENGLTSSISDAARAGVFAIWFYLIWRIVGTVQGIYGPDSAQYLKRTPIWRILLHVGAAYCLAAFCFAVIFVYLVRQDENAFSAKLNLGDALYFSIVSMTTTGYGDISPKSGWAKFVVCVQILFGFLYNVLFFSIFAGLAGRRRSG
jgi:hypothetical protein